MNHFHFFFSEKYDMLNILINYWDLYKKTKDFYHLAVVLLLWQCTAQTSPRWHWHGLHRHPFPSLPPLPAPQPQQLGRPGPTGAQISASSPHCSSSLTPGYCNESYGKLYGVPFGFIPPIFKQVPCSIPSCRRLVAARHGIILFVLDESKWLKLLFL